MTVQHACVGVHGRRASNVGSGEQDNTVVTDRAVFLTAAHIARPPPAYANAGMSCKKTSQLHGKIVALGNIGYQNATLNSMMAAIGDLARSVAVWKEVIIKLDKFINGEDAVVTEKRQENQRDMERATRIIINLNKLHDEVTERGMNLVWPRGLGHTHA
ncbi:hypothetical protein BD779DRAFT_1804105 [Infundibulicybe gibba]|nr:hypothetical protein BD779DRAFT_1804105 [Infundibulicybe gibba]